MQYYNFGVFFLNANDGIVTSEDGAYFITSDGGDSWTNGTIVGQSGLMHGAYMFDTDNIYLCATPGEVYFTNDGGSTWTSQHYDFNPSFYKVKFMDDGTGYVCGSGSTEGTILKMLPTGLGIDTIELNAWNVYPSPTTDIVNVTFDLNTSGRVNIKITNTLGKVVLNKEVNSSMGLQKSTLNVVELAKGAYILSLELNGERVKTEKIQIIR
jgi:hypothetical protein